MKKLKEVMENLYTESYEDFETNNTVIDIDIVEKCLKKIFDEHDTHIEELKNALAKAEAKRARKQAKKDNA